jgi:hypothetical protein
MSPLLLLRPQWQQPLPLCPWQPVHASACLSLSAPQALLLPLLHRQPLPQQLQQQLPPPLQLLPPSPAACVVALLLQPPPRLPPLLQLLLAAGHACVWLLSPQAQHLLKPVTLLRCYQQSGSLTMQPWQHAVAAAAVGPPLAPRLPQHPHSPAQQPHHHLQQQQLLRWSHESAVAAAAAVAVEPAAEGM